MQEHRLYSECDEIRGLSGLPSSEQKKLAGEPSAQANTHWT